MQNYEVCSFFIVISVQGSTTYNFERVADFLSLMHPWRIISEVFLHS